MLAALTMALLIGLTGLTASGLSTSHVIDQMDLLTLGEVQQLQQEMDRIRAGYGLDVVLVITDQLEGKTSRDFADDFYDFKGYGVGPEASGLLMLVNMRDREVWISTTGHAMDVFTDHRLDQIIDQVRAQLEEGAFFAAGQVFLSKVESFAQQGVPEGQYRAPEEPPTFLQKTVRMMLYWPIYVAGLIISGVTTFAASSGHRAGSKTSASFYQPVGSFALLDKKDQFLRQTTRRVLIPKNNNSGGGGLSGGGGIGRSSTHTGSSGRSHGGRGGKF